MMKVKTIDTNAAKKALKKCPKEVRDYVAALERVYEMNKRTLHMAIAKLREKP